MGIQADWMNKIGVGVVSIPLGIDSIKIDQIGETTDPVGNRWEGTATYVIVDNRATAGGLYEQYPFLLEDYDKLAMLQNHIILQSTE